MGIRQYRLGMEHGRKGIRAMAHRNCRQYDSRSANESYIQGYAKGADERYRTEKKVSLDYNNPLNNKYYGG